MPIHVHSRSLAAHSLDHDGFCILKSHFTAPLIHRTREAFAPILADHLAKHQPNRGPNRYFLSMPFDCFAPEFFFDPAILGILRGAMDDRIVADQWGCDIPVQGSHHQEPHADYQRPLFAEAPDLPLPAYMLVVSFGLVDIHKSNGPIEIGPGMHRMPRTESLRALASGEIAMQPISLEIGDVLVRHPWALHRGTPNITDTPRPLVTIRYVRRWYADSSRDVNPIPRALWESFTPEQQALLRFPLAR